MTAVQVKISRQHFDSTFVGSITLPLLLLLLLGLVVEGRRAFLDVLLVGDAVGITYFFFT